MDIKTVQYFLAVCVQRNFDKAALANGYLSRQFPLLSKAAIRGFQIGTQWIQTFAPKKRANNWAAWHLGVQRTARLVTVARWLHHRDGQQDRASLKLSHSPTLL
jgi:hypothetical protein